MVMKDVSESECVIKQRKKQHAKYLINPPILWSDRSDLTEGKYPYAPNVVPEGLLKSYKAIVT